MQNKNSKKIGGQGVHKRRFQYLIFKKGSISVESIENECKNQSVLSISKPHICQNNVHVITDLVQDHELVSNSCLIFHSFLDIFLILHF